MNSSLLSTKLTTVKTSVLIKKSFCRQLRFYKSGESIQPTWTNNGKRLIRTAKVKFFLLSLLTGPSTKSSIWTMTTTRMTLKLLHLNKAHLNKLESRALVRVTANVRAKCLNQKYHNPQAKVKITYGKPLK